MLGSVFSSTPALGRSEDSTESSSESQQSLEGEIIPVKIEEPRIFQNLGRQNTDIYANVG